MLANRLLLLLLCLLLLLLLLRSWRLGPTRQLLVLCSLYRGRRGGKVDFYVRLDDRYRSAGGFGLHFEHVKFVRPIVVAYAYHVALGERCPVAQCILEDSARIRYLHKFVANRLKLHEGALLQRSTRYSDNVALVY